MSLISKDISELIRHIAKTGKYDLLEGTVTDVNESDYTLTVKLAEDIELDDVKIRAAVGGKAGLIVIPKKGSSVVFGRLRGEADYVLLAFSELQKIVHEIGDEVKGEITDKKCEQKVGTCQLIITNDGFEITKDGESIKKILTDIMAAIIKLTVTTGVGPSGTPINAAEFTAINQRINNLFK